MLAFPCLLAACGGGGDGEEVSIAGFDLSILSAYFLENIDAALESNAAALRNSDARYTRQELTWSYSGPSGSKNLDSFPIASSRLEYAHAAGLTGAGQTIAVLDDGFRFDHEVFAGADIEGGSGLPVFSHGTTVASQLVGSSASMIGFAPGATLAPSSYTGGQASMAAATRRARDLGAVVQNNSWGYNFDISEANVNTAFGSPAGQDYLDALRAYTERGVVVFSADNDQTRTSSSIMEALPAVLPELEDGWIAVVAAVPEYDNNRILSAELVSTGCLDAARWCLTTDGVWDGAQSASATSYGLSAGTSFAAPQVSGAMALLAQAFPNLTPHALRIRLLASADNGFFAPDGQMELIDGFSHGYSDAFGHGFLDIRAALLPIGQTALSMSDGSARPVDTPLVVTGAAVGDAVARSLGDVDVLVTDTLGGDFPVEAASLVAQTEPSPLAPALLTAAMGRDLRAERVALDPVPRGLLHALPGREMTVTSPDGVLTSSVLMPSGGGPDEEFGLSMHRLLPFLSGQAAVGVTVGRDRGSVLGLGDPASRGEGSGLVALDLGLTQEDAGGTFLRIGGQFGLADLGDTGTINGVDRAGFNSFGIDIGQRHLFSRDDRLTLGLSMPVALASGSGSVQLPTSRSASGLVFDEIPVDLAPQSRQVDISVSYQVPLGRRSELLLQLTHAENHGHINGRTSTAGLVGFRIAF